MKIKIISNEELNTLNHIELAIVQDKYKLILANPAKYNIKLEERDYALIEKIIETCDILIEKELSLFTSSFANVKNIHI